MVFINSPLIKICLVLGTACELLKMCYFVLCTLKDGNPVSQYVCSGS